MKTIRTLFKVFKASHQENLQGKILLAVESLRNSQMRRRMQMTYASLFLSGVGIVAMGFVYGGALVQSEFWSIISLFFSDALTVINYWNEFSLLLMETIPIIPILLLLIPTFVFLVSLSMYFKTREVRRYSY